MEILLVVVVAAVVGLVVRALRYPSRPGRAQGDDTSWMYLAQTDSTSAGAGERGRDADCDQGNESGCSPSDGGGDSGGGGDAGGGDSGSSGD
jgi:hypothetical protein